MLEDDHGATMRLAKLEKISRVSMRPTLQLVDACQKLILSKFLLCGPGLFSYRRQSTSTESILLKVNTFTIVFASQKTSSFSSTRVFFLEQARPFDTADPPQTPAINALRQAMAAGSGPGGS